MEEQRPIEDPQATPVPPEPREETLSRMQAQAKTDRELARQKREAARQARRRREAEDDDPTCGDRPRRHGRRFYRLRRKLLFWLITLLVLLAAILILWPIVRDRLTGLFTPSFDITIPASLSDILPDETMGYNAIDFSNAILGESRLKQALVVMEQDAQVTSQISQSLLNIPLFSMAKLIHSYGTGVYTVDLSQLTEQDVSVDQQTNIVTVAVPHATLQYITVDTARTELEDTKKALLAIGDIKLTQEQQSLLDQSVDEALTAQLAAPAVLTKADEVALTKVRELFQPLVSAISKDYIVKVVMP